MDHHNEHSFISVLFDFSFSHFIVLRFVKLVFSILLLGDCAICLWLIIVSFGAGVGWGFLMILVSPVLFFVLAVLFRVWTEMLVVIFRIAEDIEELTEAQRETGSSPSDKTA
jgi:hypothetical protein